MNTLCKWGEKNFSMLIKFLLRTHTHTHTQNSLHLEYGCSHYGNKLKFTCGIKQRNNGNEDSNHTYNSITLVIAETAGSYHVYWQKHRLYFRCVFSIWQNKTIKETKKIQIVYTDSLKYKYWILNIHVFRKPTLKSINTSVWRDNIY